MAANNDSSRSDTASPAASGPVIQAPPTVVNSSSNAGPLLLLGAGAAALLLLTDNPVKSVVKDVEEIVGGAAKVVTSATDMISLSLTWPKLLEEYLRFPKKQKAEIFYKQIYPELIKAAASGAFARGTLFLGFDPSLAIYTAQSTQLWTALERHKNVYQAPIRMGAHFVHDLAHVVFADNGNRALYGWYGGVPEWAQASVIAVHATAPLIAYNGWVIGVDPSLQFVLDIFRYGQSQDDGFNIWPDGSDDHPREGWTEGFLVTALFRSVVPNVPVGFTQGRVLSAQTNFWMPDGTGIRGFRLSPLTDGWIVKLFWPANTSGLTPDGEHMPIRCSPDDNASFMCCVGSISRGGREVVPADCKIGDDRNVTLVTVPAPADRVFDTWPSYPHTTLVVQIDGRNELAKPDFDFTASLSKISLVPDRFGLYPEEFPSWYTDAMDTAGLTGQRQLILANSQP